MADPTRELPETAPLFDVRRGLYDRWQEAYRLAYSLSPDVCLRDEWSARVGWPLTDVAAEIERMARAVAKRRHPDAFKPPAETAERPAPHVDPSLVRA